MVSSKMKRAKFINNAINFLRLNKLDGIDLDWEYPGNNLDREYPSNNLN